MVVLWLQSIQTHNHNLDIVNYNVLETAYTRKTIKVSMCNFTPLGARGHEHTDKKALQVIDSNSQEANCDISSLYLNIKLTDPHFLQYVHFKKMLVSYI